MITGARKGFVQGSPTKEQLSQIPDMDFLLELLKDPGFREAVDRIEKHDGFTSALKVAAFKMAVKHTQSDRRMLIQKKMIDKSLKNKE
ncbi:MAG: hypothetical protein EHM12_11315 [Dehalococcoidia bacterium]|nr:MAG: hypothetical protein EHM12_11315 [Dehalococcoidia bacterium]